MHKRRKNLVKKNIFTKRIPNDEFEVVKLV